MARTEITAQTRPSTKNPANSALTWGATDAVNHNSFSLSGQPMLFIRNDDVGSQTITLKSVADQSGRVEDEAIVVAAGEYAMAGPFTATGWRQADGLFWIDTTDADLMVAVLRT